MRGAARAPRRVVVLALEVDRLGLELADVAPDRQLVEHHLEVIVVDDSLAELFYLRLLKALFAQGFEANALAEFDLIQRSRGPVALEQRTEVLPLDLDVGGRTIWEVVEGVDLTGVCEWSNLLSESEGLSGGIPESLE